MFPPQGHGRDRDGRKQDDTSRNAGSRPLIVRGAVEEGQPGRPKEPAQVGDRRRQGIDGSRRQRQGQGLEVAAVATWPARAPSPRRRQPSAPRGATFPAAAGPHDAVPGAVADLALLGTGEPAQWPIIQQQQQQRQRNQHRLGH